MEGLGWWIYLCSVAGATTGNITHKVATIKGLCRRCIDFINEYGLE